MHGYIQRTRNSTYCASRNTFEKNGQGFGRKAEVQQSPKREGRNMIMFLTPRKTPLIKKESETTEPKKALRTID